jgi:hypothetical protein
MYSHICVIYDTSKIQRGMCEISELHTWRFFFYNRCNIYRGVAKGEQIITFGIAWGLPVTALYL